MSRELAEHHRQLLTDSAISDEVIASRDYWTATRKAELETLGFKRFQCNVPALVIPIRDARGEIVTYQIRPDQPRIADNGKRVKYESPGESRPALDVPTRCVAERLRSPLVPLWITEGARKADAAVSAGLCCVSVAGVWSWAKRLNRDAREVLPDLQRARFEDRKVVIAFDSDVMTRPQVYKALEALNEYLVSQGALAHFCYLPELEPGAKTGLDDFLAAGKTVEELWEHVEQELRPAPEEARAPALPAAQLLAAVEGLLRRYIVFPDEHQPAALALYTLHTWAIGAFDVTPYMFVKSPQKRSGKTRALEVLELVCRNPLRAASITEAAIFQAIEAMGPTLLIDEIDAIFTSRSERAEHLRGVLNAGNRRGSKVLRGTQEGLPQLSETFCPKVLAGIDAGRLPDTIRDRAIVISLERKRRDEQVERLRARDIEGPAAELTSRLEDWAAAHGESLADYRGELPPTISDRLEEAWEPLLAIAELAGGDWPSRAREAALALASGAEDAGEDHGQLLLEALERIFGKREAMFTTDICGALNADDELPFGAYRRGEGIDGRGLSRKLKPYGIKPTTVSIGGAKAKGYHRAGFAEVWERYVRTHDPSVEPFHPLLRHRNGANPVAERDSAVTDPVTDSEPPSVTTGPVTDTGTPSVTPVLALQSQKDGCGNGVTDGTDEVRPSARTHFDTEGRTARGRELEDRAHEVADDPTSKFIRGETDELELGDGAEWTAEAADGFITRAREVFPGATEVSESTWTARSGSGIEPTAEQCADGRERVRLWQKHGVRWVHTPPEPATPSEQGGFDLEAWRRSADAWLEDTARCHGRLKKSGERCKHKRNPGSPFCGVHGRPA